MSDDDTYEIPLQDQRVFGAGMKRQRVKFVPSTSTSSVAPEPTTTPARSVSDFYLGLVLSKDIHESRESGAQSNPPSNAPTSCADKGFPPSSTIESSEIQVCDICNLPLRSTHQLVIPLPNNETADSQKQLPKPKPHPHEASLPHQLCLSHSHPPSHLDRNRKGLAYLSAYGWDPDSRRGLGSEGQGIQFPIKTKPKDDKLGIGVMLPKPGEVKKKDKVQRLDAGKARKLQEKDRRKGEKLREMFYRSEDVERHLGRE